MLTLSCARFRRCLPLLAIVPLPPAVVCIVLPVKSVNGFRRVRTVLGPMASLSALQADILVGLPLAFTLSFFATFTLGILSIVLALVLPAILREMTKSSTRVALLVTML